MTEWTGREQERVDRCDVVIVGAGIVGAAVAARLVLEGIETALLDAQEVAGGATGRCAGLVLTGLSSPYSRVVADHGRQLAPEIWALTVEGRQRLVAAADSLEVPVEPTGSLAVAVNEAEADILGESASLMREDGFDASFDRGDPLNRDFCAALRCSKDVTVDAKVLSQALLSSSDVVVHEGTEVQALELERDGVRVWAHGRTVFCSAVVLAIDSYAPLLDSFFVDKISPTSGLVLATEPLDDIVLEQPCCANDGYTYCRQLPDHRVLFGGWRRSYTPSLDGEVDSTLEDGLHRFASRHFPEVQVERADRWSGLGGFTSDGLPLVGRLPDLPPVYFGVGLGSRGLAWAFVVAERVTELMLHDTDPGLLSVARLA